MIGNIPFDPYWEKKDGRRNKRHPKLRMDDRIRRTQRTQAMLEFMAMGWSMRQVAKHLKVNVSTISRDYRKAMNHDNEEARDLAQERYRVVIELRRILDRLLELDVQRGMVTSEDVLGTKLFPIIKAMEECYGPLARTANLRGDTAFPSSPSATRSSRPSS